MSLEFSKLVSEVEAMGAALARRAGELSEMLPDARARLQAIGLADDELREKIKRAGDRWRGAIPTAEPVSATFPLPAHPPQADILGADGSQVYPDRHGSALYYLINVGSILYSYGAEGAPVCRSASTVYYEDADLYGETEGLIPTALIDGKRDTAELSELARLAESCHAEPLRRAQGKLFAGHSPGTCIRGKCERSEESQSPAQGKLREASRPASPPTLALVDNGLMLWLALEARQVHRPQVDEILRVYIDQLDRIQASDGTIAGFVGRPRNASVLTLLHLASLPLENINEDTLKTARYRGLTDRTLFEYVLRPGERSAVFRSSSLVNLDFKARGHEMYFFYLNCGRPGKKEVARVEVPQWVALDPNRLAFVHAAIVEQCRVPDGFPYVLVRAHELAVVTMEERRAMDEMVQGALLRQGLRSAISQKAQTKQWTGARRRHRL